MSGMRCGIRIQFSAYTKINLGSVGKERGVQTYLKNASSSLRFISDSRVGSVFAWRDVVKDKRSTSVVKKVFFIVTVLDGTDGDTKWTDVERW